jgi:hypothetical protein
MVAGIAVSFARREAILACGVFLGGYCILTICFISFSNTLNNNNYTKSFALAILEKVPITDNLVAYGYVSPRVVHYFGRPVPVIEDKSLLYERYDQGNWVIATDGELEELEKDSRFRKVYCNEKAEVRKRYDTRGVLFHKSAAPVPSARRPALRETQGQAKAETGVEDEDNGGLKAPPRLPVGRQERGRGQ